MYFLHGKLVAKEGQGKALSQILIQAAELVKKADGCHVYLISQSDDAPNEVWITEVWDNEEAHDNSLKNPEVRALIGQAMPMIGEPPAKGQSLTVVGGHPDFS